MSGYQMRMVVMNAYSGEKWRQKVAKMTDEQVVAVYYSLLKQGKIR